MQLALRSTDIAPIGIGFYTAPEAARLTKIPVRSINRWLGGYSSRQSGDVVWVPPLWAAQLPRSNSTNELGFRDLVELRFVAAFLAAGLALKTIRNSLNHAKDRVGDDRPFSTRRFQTDGKTIFLDSLRQAGETETSGLKAKRYVFHDVVRATFKDLDVEQDAVVRWRPFHGKPTIVVDPQRAFGQPIAANSGTPTVVLADAVRAERSVSRVAKLFDVDDATVSDAVKFEAFLAAT